MRWKEGLDIKMISLKTICVLVALNLMQTCHCARQLANRRKDTSLYLPEPSAQSLTAIAQAMGAAGFEDYTEGKTLVKRLITADDQSELDVVEHMGVIGKAGVDFPALPNIPKTGFNCKNVPTGYYADLETDCQVFHICDTSRKISFLCPNGTIFSQSHLICDWWFKVDCASAPALYEASVEYYSNEQKKSQKVGRTLSKNSNNRNVGSDSQVRTESRKAPISSTTEKLLRQSQNSQTNEPVPTDVPTTRNYQTIFDISPTYATTEFENRKKNLVQLISNDFSNYPSKTTLPVYDSTTRKTTEPVYDHNSLREMQVAAETASFAQNQNRQFLQEYNSKNLRPYPVYNHNLQVKPSKTKTLTTLYDITATNAPQYTQQATTKRQTLLSYTKSYTINDNRDPYTRPGVSLLREFLEKERNKTLLATTEKIATIRSDKQKSKINPEKKGETDNRSSFESTSKIPYTSKTVGQTETILNVEHSTEPTTEISYKDRRERLLRKIALDRKDAETTPPTVVTEKYYGNQSNRPGLVVPPSLTPKTLHSLAIYYATALDNFATTPTPEDTETTTYSMDMYEKVTEGLPPLFSKQTITKYGNLFGHGTGNAEMLENIKIDPNSSINELAEDLSAQMSQGPLASSPQIRELAQIFTHALSAYLQDPVKFRKVLSDIRPTHPSFSDMLVDTDASFNTESTTTVNEEDDEILGFSDDHKIRAIENSLRSGKSINIATDYPTTIEEVTTTVQPTTEIETTTTPRSPFRCCGRISASYTTAPTPSKHYFTSIPSNTFAAGKINSLTNYNTETPKSEYINTKLSNGYFINSNIKQLPVTDSQFSNDYTETTTLTTESDIDIFDSTLSPITNSHQSFESKKIKTTTSTPESTPKNFAETDSIELENEEELQRAHSQSFVTPQANSVRKGKQINQFVNKELKKPAEDLEAPTQASIDLTTLAPTTTQATASTLSDQTSTLTTVNPSQTSIFTSPDSEKNNNDFQWPTTFGNWQSTIIDPITLNDGLSSTGPEQVVSEISQQTNEWPLEAATTQSTFITTNEPVSTTTVNVEITTNIKNDERFGRLLSDPSSTEASQDISTVTDTIVEKAKQIMGGMNSTTTQKLMNVMKKTKSKTVKRLILLLVQTCDDDHNSTAEASKKALLEALMAVSQKDMDEIEKEEESIETHSTESLPDVKTKEFERRMDRIQVEPRQNKNINTEAEEVNSLSTPTTTESFKTEETQTTPVTTARTTRTSRRGSRKYSFSTESEQTHTTAGDRPLAEARTGPRPEVKTQSDTRALELLRSLYTIAARWGK
ncbi:uncharacterized protein LOC116774108 [Danaus plexippus]|uniref:uncharacterized protein LOC116774108 n=1 Tax=Danaus plexippus TaxID=13037 RepID=UPI002AB29FAC|nr:uncharacterized protein LOC116774108 [Danaus plexippus]